MKKTILFIFSLGMCAGLFAQGELDAFRLSGAGLQGTARGQAMGGAFGALGGDVTGIMVNPAGLGVYRSSEINGSLFLNSTGIETNWNNTLEKKNTTGVNFDNASYVGYFPTGREDWTAVNLAVSYNRLKNFDRTYIASATGVNSSITDYIARKTKGIDFDDLNSYSDYDPYAYENWLSILGWQTNMIVRMPNGNGGYMRNEYTGLYPNELVAPRLAMKERGRIDAYDFSAGTSWMDQFYFGLTFSLTDIFYRLESQYGETFGNRIAEIGLDNNYYETKGNGVQVKAGVIWRPRNCLRLGVAYYSPTWYALTDYYQGRAKSVFYDDASVHLATTPEYALTSYHLNTPYSWVFSAAGIFGTKAIVSVDYEIKDYAAMNLRDANGNEYREDNECIRDDFKMSSTLRAGLEYKFTPRFSGRLGYAYVGSPCQKDFANGTVQPGIIGTVPHYTLESNGVNYFTAGIGYRFTPDVYLDAAFVYRTQKDDLYAYPLPFNDSQAATLTSNTCKGVVTLGYKF